MKKEFYWDVAFEFILKCIVKLDNKELFGHPKIVSKERILASRLPSRLLKLEEKFHSPHLSETFEYQSLKAKNPIWDLFMT